MLSPPSLNSHNMLFRKVWFFHYLDSGRIRETRLSRLALLEDEDICHVVQMSGLLMRFDDPAVALVGKSQYRPLRSGLHLHIAA
jgi:hypothetical protein